MALYRAVTKSITTDGAGAGSFGVSLGDFGGAARVASVYCNFAAGADAGIDTTLTDEQTGEVIALLTDDKADQRVAVDKVCGSRITITVAQGGATVTDALIATVYLEVG